MNEIKIVNQTEIEGGFEFVVSVDGSQFKVKVDNDYHLKLTKAKQSMEDLITKSFEFLLEREPKESILKKFNLQIINKYFPEYEEVIKNQTDGKNI